MPQATIKGPDYSLQDCFMVPDGSSAVVITPIFQRAGKKEEGRAEGDMSLLIKVPRASQA